GGAKQQSVRFCAAGPPPVLFPNECSGRVQIRFCWPVHPALHEHVCCLCPPPKRLRLAPVKPCEQPLLHRVSPCEILVVAVQLCHFFWRQIIPLTAAPHRQELRPNLLHVQVVAVVDCSALDGPETPVARGV